MMKNKRIKILAGLAVFALLLVWVVPMFTQGKLADSIKKQVNKQLTATLDFEDAHLRLFHSFPKITLEIENITLVNAAPFEGDTLLKLGLARVDLPWSSLFASGADPFRVDHFSLSDGYLNLVSDSIGRVNYDIMAPEEAGGEQEEENSDSETVLSLNRYELNNISLHYTDEAGGYEFVLDSLYHSGTGDLSASTTQLDTDTRALLSVRYGRDTILNSNPLDWKAVLEIDLEEQRYRFADNMAHINRLPLVFEGEVHMPEEAVAIDLTLHTPTSEFRQLLELVPEKYSGDLTAVNTYGVFEVGGWIKGRITEEEIPKFEFAVKADEAGFHYRGMPSSVDDIRVRAVLENSTAKAEDTRFMADTLHFVLEGNALDASLNVEKIGENPEIDLGVKGVLDLRKLAQAFPSEETEGLRGILDMDLRSHFDQAAVTNGDYERIRNRGKVKLQDISYHTEYLPQALVVESASLEFRQDALELRNARIKTGASDLAVRGSIPHFMNTFRDDAILSARLSMESDFLKVSDLIPVEEEEAEGQGGEETEAEPLIPAFLDLDLTGMANTVDYEGMELSGVMAAIRIKEQKITFESLSARAFGGRLGMTGELDGSEAAAEYDLELNMDQFAIAPAVEQIAVLSKLAPIAKAFDGSFRGKMALKGGLDQALDPVLQSLSGLFEAEVQTKGVDKSKLGLPQSWQEQNFLFSSDAFKNKNFATQFAFEEGRGVLKPMPFTLGDVKGTLEGSHGFDGEMTYALNLEVPASYMGDEVMKLASGLKINDLDKRKVPLRIDIGGTVKRPQFKANTEEAVKEFAASLVKEKQDELVKKGEDEVKKALGNLLDPGKDAKDSTAAGSGEDAVKKAAGSLINNLFKKKKKDSTQQLIPQRLPEE